MIQTDYISITNNQFRRITNQFNPENSGISLFMKYNSVHGRDYLIDTLDSFAHLLGIDFNVDTLTSKYPTLYFVYHKGNVFGKPNGPSRYQDLRLKSYADNQKIIVKDFFEILSFIDIKKHITTNKIQDLEEFL